MLVSFKYLQSNFRLCLYILCLAAILQILTCSTASCCIVFGMGQNSISTGRTPTRMSRHQPFLTRRMIEENGSQSFRQLGLMQLSSASIMDVRPQDAEHGLRLAQSAAWELTVAENQSVAESASRPAMRHAV